MNLFCETMIQLYKPKEKRKKPKTVNAIFGFFLFSFGLSFIR